MYYRVPILSNPQQTYIRVTFKINSSCKIQVAFISIFIFFLNWERPKGTIYDNNPLCRNKFCFTYTVQRYLTADTDNLSLFGEEKVHLQCLLFLHTAWFPPLFSYLTNVKCHGNHNYQGRVYII